MTCLGERETAFMERYLNDELSEGEREDFEAHVLECDECATDVVALSALRTDLEGHREEIEGTEVSKSGGTWHVWLALAAVGLISLLVL